MAAEISEYIKERLKNQQNWYMDKASKNKSRFMSYQTIIIILGAIIPLIVVFGGFVDLFFSGIVALVFKRFVAWEIMSDTQIFPVITTAHFSAAIAAVIAILAGIDKLTQPQANWFNYRANEEMLKKEEWMYQFKTGPYTGLNDGGAEKLLVDRVESIISADIARFASAEYKTAQEDPNDKNKLQDGDAE